jgi:uncharacterized membrane protein YdjX (TVP38/TMEM64 family)
MKFDKNSLFEAFTVVILFIVMTYIVHVNFPFFESLMDHSFLGMLFYVFITIIAIVIAPVSTLPLIPMATFMWGPFVSAVLSIVGWTLGSLIAFILARYYGVGLVEKFVSLKHIQKIEKTIPKENLFWSVVFLRMTIPVDVLSYALGLFSRISLKSYFVATLIGVTPFAFIFAYLGGVEAYYQILIFLLIAAMIFIGAIVRKYLDRTKK